VSGRLLDDMRELAEFGSQRDVKDLSIFISQTLFRMAQVSQGPIPCYTISEQEWNLPVQKIIEKFDDGSFLEAFSKPGISEYQYDQYLLAKRRQNFGHAFRVIAGLMEYIRKMPATPLVSQKIMLRDGPGTGLFPAIIQTDADLFRIDHEHQLGPLKVFGRRSGNSTDRELGYHHRCGHLRRRPGTPMDAPKEVEVSPCEVRVDKKGLGDLLDPTDGPAGPRKTGLNSGTRTRVK
jgi:hypothetical protein